MTLSVDALFLAVESNNYSLLWKLMQAMSQAELVSAGTAMGPDRLRELLFRFVRQSSAPSPAARAVNQSMPISTLPQTVIPELLAQAFNDRSFLGASKDNELASTVRKQLWAVHAQRAATPQIRIFRDITHTLAQPAFCPAPLTDSDFAAASTRQGVSVPAIKAVAQVESGGRSGFDDQYRAKILFEAHHFRKYTNRMFDLSHPHLSCERGEAKKYYAWDQYNRLFEAMILHPVAAIKACSWGKFQVLGSNHNGWPDPVSFARAMQISESNHLKSFEAYCVDNGLIVHLKNKDWAKFARGYNGARYADFAYDKKIETAYKKFGGT